MIASASSAAGMRPSTLNVFRSNITTRWSLPDVANPWPVSADDRRPVRALNAGDLTEQRAVVLVDDHHAILPAR